MRPGAGGHSHPLQTSCLQRRGHGSISGPCSLLSSGFCSTYMKVKQFIKADRNKVRAQRALAPPGCIGLLLAEARLVFQWDVGRAGKQEGQWQHWWQELAVPFATW